MLVTLAAGIPLRTQLIIKGVKFIVWTILGTGGQKKNNV